MITLVQTQLLMTNILALQSAWGPPGTPDYCLGLRIWSNSAKMVPSGSERHDFGVVMNFNQGSWIAVGPLNCWKWVRFFDELQYRWTRFSCWAKNSRKLTTLARKCWHSHQSSSLRTKWFWNQRRIRKINLANITSEAQMIWFWRWRNRWHQGCHHQ